MNTAHFTKVLLGDMAFCWGAALIVCFLISIRMFIFFIKRGIKRRNRRVRGGKKKRGLPDDIIGRIVVCVILMLIASVYTANQIADVINMDYSSVHGVCHKEHNRSSHYIVVEADNGKEYGFLAPTLTRNMAYPMEYNRELTGTVWYAKKSRIIVGFVPDEHENIDWKYANSCSSEYNTPSQQIYYEQLVRNITYYAANLSGTKNYIQAKKVCCAL